MSETKEPKAHLSACRRVFLEPIILEQCLDRNIPMRKYIVCYDIESNKVRLKVSKILERVGLYRIQYSVFCGEMTDKTKKSMIKSVRLLSLLPSDSVILIPFQNKMEEIRGDRIERLGLEQEIIII